MSLRGRRSLKESDGFTLLELLLVVAVISIIAGMAIPSLLRSRTVANETSALGSLRAVNTGQLSYALTCGRGYYASSFPALALGPFGTAGYLSSELTAVASPVKSGYTFSMVSGAGAVAGIPDCNNAANTTTGYYVTAVPVNAGSGVRTFAANQGGAIWQNTAGAPPPEPFAVGPGVAPVQ